MNGFDFSTLPYLGGGCMSSKPCSSCKIKLVCDSGYAQEDPYIHRDKGICYVNGPCCCATIECPECAARINSLTKQRSDAVEFSKRNYGRFFTNGPVAVCPTLKIKEEDFNRAIVNYCETNDAFDEISELATDKYIKKDALKIKSIFFNLNGFEILDIEAWIVWSWHSIDYCAGWLELGSEKDIQRVFEDFIKQW